MNKPIFCYGTLQHLPLLDIVAGEVPAHKPASLPHHVVKAATGGPFPQIRPLDEALCEGLLLTDPSDSTIARVDYYEGCFGYVRRTLPLADGAMADVYFPPERQTATGTPWSLADWQADWADLSVEAAREVMGYMDSKPPGEVAKMFPMIRARAASTVRAASARHDTGTLKGRVEVASRRRAYARFWALDDLDIRHERFDGSMSDTLDRAVFVAADAAFVLPYDPVRDCVLVIEQVRIAAIARGDPNPWFYEPIAGRIDPGETPQDAARREAEEEAGLSIDAMEPIAEIYPSAGCSTEFFYLFLGLADLPETASGQGGLATENEDIRSHLWSFDELMDRVARFDLANNILVLSAYYLAHHRARLRSAGARRTPKGH